MRKMYLVSAGYSFKLAFDNLPAATRLMEMIERGQPVVYDCEKNNGSYVLKPNTPDCEIKIITVNLNLSPEKEFTP